MFAQTAKTVFKEQICRTPGIKIGLKKLNMLAHLIKGQSVETAMLRLMFVQKEKQQQILWAIREGCRIAKQEQGLNASDLYVAYAYLCRGQYTKGLDIKGRGRCGIMKHPTSQMVIMLREKGFQQQKNAAEEAAKLRRVPMPRPDRAITGQRVKL